MTRTDILDMVNRKEVERMPGDYLKDGLLYCGKCNQPKQARLDDYSRPVTVSCECRERERQQEEEQEHARRVAELSKKCFPQISMTRHSFENAAQDNHILIAKNYVDEWENMKRENIGLLFFGPTGTGKTFAAQCIANALLEKEIPVRYFSAVDLVAAFMDKETKRSDMMAKLCSVPLLIIDDIGAERDTAFSREQLCSVIDARTESGKPLIVTTNYSLSDMDRLTDNSLQRMFDRLRACCVPVMVTGESKRKAIKEEKLEYARKLFGEG